MGGFGVCSRGLFVRGDDFRAGHRRRIVLGLCIWLALGSRLIALVGVILLGFLGQTGQLSID